MKLSLGFSPCPNDTFIFAALVNGWIDTEGLTFDLVLADVEELNQRAFAGDLSITKLSYHAYAFLLQKYILLNAGSALGRNCGPLLIAREPLSAQQLQQGRVAIPGRYTTANFLLGLAYPQIRKKKEMLFSDIEAAVVNGEVSTGLIIHENRFTYQEKGLVKIADLGEYWEQTTGQPIPLGGIVIKRSLPIAVQQKVDRVLARSVAYALAQPAQVMPYVRRYAQSMDDAVIQAHIGLYVNDFTLDLGAQGRAAVSYLFEQARAKDLVPASDLPIGLGWPSV